MQIRVYFLYVVLCFLCLPCGFAQDSEFVLTQYPSNSKFLEQLQSKPKNILCIDVGNTCVKLGFFDYENRWRVLAFSSKHAVDEAAWTDALTAIRAEYRPDMPTFEAVRVSSVKPEVNTALRQAMHTSLQQEPIFLSVKNCYPLKILIDHPEKLGTDMIAASLAARLYFPQCTVLVSVFGTATVVFAVNTRYEFLGVTIMPGVDMSFRALSENTSQLGLFDAAKPACVLGRNTQAAIQSGVYYMQLGGVREVMKHFESGNEGACSTSLTKIMAGGHSLLFSEGQSFDATIPDLVVQGLLWMDLTQSN